MRVELLTADMNHVAWVELLPLVSPRSPDVVMWGSRTFIRQPRPNGADHGDSIFHWVEGFSVVSRTPSPGLPHQHSTCPHGVAQFVALDNPCAECAAPPPVDRGARTLTDGSPVPADGSHTETRPDGQQQDYVVLSEEERAKGFVRPEGTTQKVGT